MRVLDALRLAVAFIFLVALQFSVQPLLGWRAAPDFLVIALLLVAIRVRPGTAAVVGTLLGLAADTLSPQTFGATALSMCVVAFAASWLKAVFFADDVVLTAFFFFLGKWAFDLLYVLTAHRHGTADTVTQLLVWSPLSGATTAATGLVVLLFLRPLLRWRAA